jgi:hypothetical protein
VALLSESDDLTAPRTEAMETNNCLKGGKTGKCVFRCDLVLLLYLMHVPHVRHYYAFCCSPQQVLVCQDCTLGMRAKK